MRNSDLLIIFLAKAIRTFGFGYISVITAMYLAELGFSAIAIGAVLTATLIEDAVLTSTIAVIAHRVGVKVLLMAAPVMVVLAGLTLGLAHDPWIIAIAAVIGIISPAGQEGGPFSALEQALIPGLVSRDHLTRTFSWYNIAGFVPSAFGALAAGLWLDAADKLGLSHLDGYRALFLLYAASGLLLAVLYAFLKAKLATGTPKESATKPPSGSAAEPPADKAAEPPQPEKKLGLHRSRRHVFELSALFAVDSFAGGFVVQSMIVYWFHLRYHVGAEELGPLFFATNILAGFSFLLAPRIAARIGLLKTMLVTHLPCSIALALIPLMPTYAAAAWLMIARSLFSSMDVPTRQTYTMVLVADDERPAAASFMASARSVAQGLAPIFAGMTMAGAASGLPFYIAGSLKSIYDLTIYARFRKVPLEQHEGDQAGT